MFSLLRILNFRVFFLFFVVFICFSNFLLCEDIFISTNDLKNNDRVEYRSAIVVDANNGEILYSYNPDIKIYPASLTKMMTSYLVFSAIEKGIVGINDKTARNNNITIKDLLYKMTINSQNNVTNILAEETYGGVNEFVKLMNEKAIEMNMQHTHFANTNGLFNKVHYSTVRDIAKLNIRLVYDFPQYINIFGITNYIDENSEYNIKTTNIQQNIKGIEGTKTGYIDASGYNISAWGHYGDKHIFIVISGLSDKINRDKIVIKILNDILKKIKYNSANDINSLKKDIDVKMINNFCKSIGIDCEKYMTPKPKTRQQASKNSYFFKKP